jgi:hypothetical protein
MPRPIPNIVFETATWSARESEGFAEIFVRRTGDLSQVRRIRFELVPDTAQEETDYLLPKTSVTEFRTGQTRSRLVIPLVKSAEDLEEVESFRVRLANVEGFPVATVSIEEGEHPAVPAPPVKVELPPAPKVVVLFEPKEDSSRLMLSPEDVAFEPDQGRLDWIRVRIPWSGEKTRTGWMRLTSLAELPFFKVYSFPTNSAFHNVFAAKEIHPVNQKSDSNWIAVEVDSGAKGDLFWIDRADIGRLLVIKRLLQRKNEEERRQLEGKARELQGKGKEILGGSSDELAL